MSDWRPKSETPPDRLFHVISESGTQQANVILWRVDEEWGWRDFEKGYCVKYPDGEVWWPKGTTHWMPYLTPPPYTEV